MSLSRAIRAGAAYVELYTQDHRLVKGLQAAERRLKAFGEGITAAGQRVSALGLGIVTPLLAASQIFTSTGDTLANMSIRTGISVESLSELGFAAEQSGADLATLETSVRKMQKMLVAAAGGSQGAIDTLEQLGLTVEQLASLNPEAQFSLITDRLSQIENPTLRAAMALELFGKTGTNLLPMLADGAQGVEELRQQARDLGLTISTEDATAAEAFGDTLDLLWKVLRRVAFAIGAAVVPAVSEAAEVLTKVVSTAIRWADANRALIATVFRIGVAVTAGGIALIALGLAISAAGAAFGFVATVITTVGSGIAALGAAIAWLVTPIGLVVTGLVALSAYLLTTSKVGAQALTWLGSNFELLRSEAIASFQGIADALAAGDLALAGQVLWASLRLQWQKGIHWLEELWIGFKEFFLAVWTDASFNLASILTNSWSGLQSFWTEMVAGMSTAWALFSTGAVSGWRSAQNTIAKGIVQLMGLLDSSIDVEASMASLDDDLQREQQARSSALDSQLVGIESRRQERQQAIESERTGTLGALEEDRGRAHAERQGSFDAELRASESALLAARQEWEQALAAAATARETQASQRPDAQRAPDLDLSLLDELVSTAERKVDVVGTFNPLAAGGLGSDSLSERTARASEQVAANTKRLLQEAQQGGLVFG